ncbi:MAG: hypothetical protein ABII27_07780 [bacterium]
MCKRHLIYLSLAYLLTFHLAGITSAQDDYYFNYNYLDKYVEENKQKEAEQSKEDITGKIPVLTAPERIGFDKSEWNYMREGIEKGYVPGEYVPKRKKTKKEEEAEAKEGTQTVEEPESALSLDLPYESGLSIKGIKTIDLKYTYKKYDQKQDENDREQQTSDFDMQQSLVVNIKGKVGRKITVNVDFDDTKELEEKRDIQVRYQGDPDEVVQEAAFGDINLQLPSTEFVSYNKQVFGLRVDLKYKWLRLMAIGSRTKGTTETKRFTGNTEFKRIDKKDTDFIKRRYYKLSLDDSHLPIVRGSEKIYIDDRNASNNTPETDDLDAETYSAAPTSFSGSFDIQRPGADYTVDYEKGIITFKRTVGQNYVIVVDYKKSDGSKVTDDFTPGKLKIIKDESETVGVTQELKNYYNIGQAKIIRDNGRDNFLLKIIDLNRQDVAVLNPGGKHVPIYRNDYTTDIEVDFESGIFNFKQAQPFPDGVYEKTANNYYLIFMEYRYRVKTYLLRANIVPGSERILLNGVHLQKDIDYFIDYLSGFITFYNEGMLNETSTLEITYEYAPFGGDLGQTLVGLRGEFTLTDNLFLGSSFLYNFAPKPTSMPTPNSTPSSIKVIEADANLTDFKIGDFPLKMNLGVEYAQSIKNPNIFGRAIVESMEGIKQEDSTALHEDFWFPAINPSGTKGNYNKNTLSNEDVNTLEINPFADAEEDETQQVLAVNYEFNEVNDAVSFVYPFSKTGLDFSKKLYLEGIISGDNSGNELIISLGSVAEDSDADGALDKEDIIVQDNTINQGEDIGWVYNNSDGSVTPIGADNGRLDTEDLDGDGSLDNDNGSGSQFGGASNPLMDVDGNNHTSIDWPANSGANRWKAFQIPLGIVDANDWLAIKHLRITIKYPGTTGAKTGQIKIAHLAVVGNRFDVPEVSGTGTLGIAAINNIDNPRYQSLLSNPEYLMLYEDTSENNKEQALEIKYSNFSADSVGATRITYTKAMDLTEHERLNYFLYHDGSSKDVFIQFGSESNYFEVLIGLGSNTPSGWYRYSVRLTDENNDQTPDIMRYDDNREVTRVGNPSLKNISQIKIGIRNTAGDGYVWFNEVFLNEVTTRKGYAKRLQGDFEWPGWARFGGKYRNVDRNFETINTVITNRDKEDTSAYMNFSRISFMPINVSASRSETITPSSVDTGESALVSSNEEGKIKSDAGSADTTITIKSLPTLGLRYSFTDNTSNEQQKQDHSDRYSGDLSYNVPVRIPIINPFPSTLSSGYSLSKIYTYYRDESGRSNPLEISESVSGSVNMQPISKLKLIPFLKIPMNPIIDVNFNPSYSWSQSKEIQRFPYDLDLYKENNEFEYVKGQSQKASTNLNIKIFEWLAPSANYSIDVVESMDLLLSTTTPKSLDTKTVSRNANGKVSWTFSPNVLMGDFKLGNFKPTKSLSISSNYTISDGDSYEFVPIGQKVMSFDTDTLYIHKRGLEISSYTVTGSSTTRLKSLTWRDTVDFSSKWKPLEWIAAPKYFNSIINAYANISYSDSKEHSEKTGTVEDRNNVVWPKYTVSLSDTENLFFAQRFVTGSNVDYSFSEKEVTVKNISLSDSFTRNVNWGLKLFKTYDLYLTYENGSSSNFDVEKSIITSNSEYNGWSSQVGFYLGRWRFTPNYKTRTSMGRDSENKLTEDRDTQSMSLMVRGDLNLPKVWRLPFMSSAWVLLNRMIVDTNLSLDTVRSSLNVESDNTNTYRLSTSVDYEVSKNFRMSLSLGGSRFENIAKKDENYYTLETSTKLTIQF